MFLTSPRATEGAKPLHVLSVPGSQDKLLAKQPSTPQSPFGVLMPVERIVGSRSNFLAFVADCDKKSAFLTCNDAKAVRRLETGASGLSLVPWVFGKRCYWY